MRNVARTAHAARCNSPQSASTPNDSSFAHAPLPRFPSVPAGGGVVSTESGQPRPERPASDQDAELDYTTVLERLLARYQANGDALSVNFRKLAPFHSGIDRSTHLLHSYPAKLLLNIPFFFLHCDQLGSPGQLLDPFCGSGTVLLEGAIKGWRPSGADSNPLARLITRTKLKYLKPKVISAALQRVHDARDSQSASFSPVVNVNHWFAEPVQLQIGRILGAIDRETETEVRDFLRTCLSTCLRKASFADPRLSVPVRSKPTSGQWKKAVDIDFFDLFASAVATNGSRLEHLSDVDRTCLDSLELLNDARDVHRLTCAGQVDLVITSPPYVGAQKYIRASSLSIGWLGLAADNKLRSLERFSIGREHYARQEYARAHPDPGVAPILGSIRRANPLRAHIASVYLAEMRDALARIVQALKHGGHLVLIVGNNTVAGHKFETSQYLAEILRTLGLRLQLELIDEIRSRVLMTKRHSTAGVIDREHIQLYTKP